LPLRFDYAILIIAAAVIFATLPLATLLILSFAIAMMPILRHVFHTLFRR